MKIRNGFVSNSSSSSFIILLPENFDTNSIDFDAEVKKNKYCDCEGEDVKRVMSSFLKKKYLYAEEDGYDECSMIEEILSKYVIATIEGGPGEGQTILLDNNKVRKILNNDTN